MGGSAEIGAVMQCIGVLFLWTVQLRRLRLPLDQELR